MSDVSSCVVAGVERLTLDYVVPLGSSTPAFRSPGEVRFSSRVEAAELFELRRPGRPRLGGTVGNGLSALARHADNACTCVWNGFAGSTWLSRLGARLLRAEGIGVRPLGAITRPTRALCVLDGAGSDVAGIVVDVAPGDVVVAGEAVPADLVLVGLDQLATAVPPLATALAGRRLFLCVNHAADGLSETGSAILAGGSWIGLSGREEEVAALQLLANASGIGLDMPRALTRGAAGATIIGETECVELPPAGTQARVGSALGAGDAFAAGFALGLLQTQELAAAAQVALGICAGWLGDAPPARRARLVRRLEQLGAPGYLGAPAGVVAELAEGLAAGPSTIVCSGGQSGVDTIAAEEALGAGLASVMLLPLGLRREQPFDAADQVLTASRVVELPTRSYGDRTAAVVDACDLFIAVGDSTTEGAVAAHGMAEAMGRTLVTLDEPVEVAAAIAHERACVIGVGGPRGSRLAPSAGHAARVKLRALLRTLALGPDACRARQGTLPQRVALPSTRRVTRVCLDLVHAWCPGHAALAGGIGDWVMPARCPRCELQFALVRPRDMPSLLARGCVDAALGGLDDLLEGDVPRDVLTPTRIFESSVVVVGHRGVSAVPTRYVSQLPAAARALGFTGEFETIHGGSETWLHLYGKLSGAIDTLHTGSTTARAGLEVVAVLGRTAIQIACRRGVRVPAAWLAAWPTYTGDIAPPAPGAGS